MSLTNGTSKTRATCSTTTATRRSGHDSWATRVATRRKAACSSASSRRWLSARFVAEMSRTAPEDRLGLDLAQRQLDGELAAVRAHARQLHPPSEHAPVAGLHEASEGGGVALAKRRRHDQFGHRPPQRLLARIAKRPFGGR